MKNPDNPPFVVSAVHGRVSMDLNAHYKGQRWPENRVRGLLTDRKIEQYRREGFYSPEWRAARREIWAKRQKKREPKENRDGNFLKIDGRLIYSPI